MKAWDATSTDEDSEEISNALDAVVVAHIAAALEWEKGPPADWNEEDDKAAAGLAEAWENWIASHDDPIAEEELNIALDALAIAHSAAAFEICSGLLKW